MITIIPASDQEREVCCLRENLSAASCLILRDGEETAGYVLYKRKGVRQELLAARADDGFFLEGLVRAALNAGELEGAGEAFCVNPDLAALLEKMGFHRTGEELSVSIPTFFARPCRSTE